MTEATNSLPEAFMLLVGTSGDRVRFPNPFYAMLRAATLRELELRGRIRVSLMKHGLFAQRSPLTLELLDASTTGDEKLDACLEALRPLTMETHTDIRHCEAAMNELRIGFNLHDEFLGRLVADGWLRETGRTRFFKRTKYGVADPSRVGAMKADLFTALAGEAEPEPRDKALAALLAAVSASANSPKAIFELASEDATNPGADPARLMRAVERATEARRTDAIARALRERLLTADPTF